MTCSVPPVLRMCFASMSVQDTHVRSNASARASVTGSMTDGQSVSQSLSTVQASQLPATQQHVKHVSKVIHINIDTRGLFCFMLS